MAGRVIGVAELEHASAVLEEFAAEDFMVGSYDELQEHLRLSVDVPGSLETFVRANTTREFEVNGVGHKIQTVGHLGRFSIFSTITEPTYARPSVGISERGRRPAFYRKRAYQRVKFGLELDEDHATTRIPGGILQFTPEYTSPASIRSARAMLSSAPVESSEQLNVIISHATSDEERTFVELNGFLDVARDLVGKLVHADLQPPAIN